METVTINYSNIPFNVKGRYDAPEPELGHGSCFDVQEVYVADSDVDIMNLLSEEQKDEIRDLALEEYES